MQFSGVQLAFRGCGCLEAECLPFVLNLCHEPCLLCRTVQVRYTAKMHLFKPLCSFVKKSVHMSTCMRYMCACMHRFNAQPVRGSGGGPAAGEGQGKVEQGAGEGGKAADGVGSGKERCIVTRPERMLYPGVGLGSHTLFLVFGVHDSV